MSEIFRHYAEEIIQRYSEDHTIDELTEEKKQELYAQRRANSRFETVCVTDGDRRLLMLQPKASMAKSKNITPEIEALAEKLLTELNSDES